MALKNEQIGQIAIRNNLLNVNMELYVNEDGSVKEAEFDAAISAGLKAAHTALAGTAVEGLANLSNSIAAGLYGLFEAQQSITGTAWKMAYAAAFLDGSVRNVKDKNGKNYKSFRAFWDENAAALSAAFPDISIKSVYKFIAVAKTFACTNLPDRYSPQMLAEIVSLMGHTEERLGVTTNWNATDIEMEITRREELNSGKVLNRNQLREMLVDIQTGTTAEQRKAKEEEEKAKEEAERKEKEEKRKKEEEERNRREAERKEKERKEKEEEQKREEKRKERDEENRKREEAAHSITENAIIQARKADEEKRKAAVNFLDKISVAFETATKEGECLFPFGGKCYKISLYEEDKKAKTAKPRKTRAAKAKSEEPRKSDTENKT